MQGWPLGHTRGKETMVLKVESSYQHGKVLLRKHGNMCCKSQMRMGCCAEACSKLTILAPVSVLLLETGLERM